MMYFYPSGGCSDLGIITSPGHKGVPVGIRNGMRWIADNNAFVNGFRPDIFFPWLSSLVPYRDTCLFVTCPDMVGDAPKTLGLFKQWADSLTPWPVAFVAQDGQETLDFPPTEKWSALFVGGSTAWKDGPGAIQCIQRAQQLGKHIHIGRVNEWRRFEKFDSLPGSEEFTCDGTKTRYIGREKSIKYYKNHMERAGRLLRLPIPGVDYRRQPTNGNDRS